MMWTVPGLGSIDLIHPDVDGVMLLQDGVRGMNMPPVTRHTSKSPAVAGSRHRGWTTDERGVFWPLLVWRPNNREGTDLWHEDDAHLWSLLRPDTVGEWRVVTDRAGPRTLRARWTGDSDHAYGRDPLRHGWAIYGVELVAESPYWEGETITRTWGAGDGEGRSFLPGPPFWVGSSATVEAATLTNPGELPAHLVWYVDGPAQSAQVGFVHENMWGDITRSLIEIPFPIGAGQHLVIDTHPSAQTAILHGPGPEAVDMSGTLGDVAFRAIPAGEDVTLELRIDDAAGEGSISVELTPLYWRAL